MGMIQEVSKTQAFEMYKKETQVDIEEMDILIAFHKHNLAEDDALKTIM